MTQQVQEEIQYETEDAITSFAGSNKLFLCDDYPCIIVLGEKEYPSVRNAALSFKTLDWSMRERIRTTTLPADLKELERAIVPAPYWNKAYVIKMLRHYTVQKFVSHPPLAAKLVETFPKQLINGLMHGHTLHRFDIDEVNNDEDNEYGKILMEVRDMLRNSH